MLLVEIIKNIILEGKASSFLKFYHDIERGYDPNKAVIFECLMTLKEFYEDYFLWYKKYKTPSQKQEEWRILRDFSKRLREIKIALESNDVKKQIIAVDNGINQWHIDFPIVWHLWMNAGKRSGGHRTADQVEWEEVQDLLISLGRLSPESPYGYSGNPENFPPHKRHLAAILPRKTSRKNI